MAGAASRQLACPDTAPIFTIPLPIGSDRQRLAGYLIQACRRVLVVGPPKETSNLTRYVRGDRTAELQGLMLDLAAARSQSNSGDYR